MAFRRVVITGDNLQKTKDNLEDFFSNEIYINNYPTIKHKIILPPTKPDTIVVDLNGDGADIVSKKVKDIAMKHKMSSKIKNQIKLAAKESLNETFKTKLNDLIIEALSKGN